MNPHQSLARHQPQPEEKRHLLATVDIGRKLLRHVEIGVLNHVGRIDATLEPAIEPEANHLPQPFAVSVE